MRKGAQTLVFGSKPVILSRAAIGGKKEGEGPLAAYFDFLGKDAKLGQKTFERPRVNYRSWRWTRRSGNLASAMRTLTFCLQGTS